MVDHLIVHCQETPDFRPVGGIGVDLAVDVRNGTDHLIGIVIAVESGHGGIHRAKAAFGRGGEDAYGGVHQEVVVFPEIGLAGVAA